MSTIIARYSERLRNSAAPNAEGITAALWLILAFWGWLWFGPMWATAMKPRPDQIIDFYQDWGSARNYRVGLPIYTPHAISIPRHLSVISNSMPSIEYNAHPPTTVFLMLPLGWLGYPDAVLAWNLISLLAVAASLFLIATELKLPRAILPPTLALLALCHPLYGNFHLGQLTPVLGLLVVTIWVLDRSGCLNWAATFIGISAAFKLFPAYIGMYYAAQMRIRPLLTAVFVFLALNLITVLVLGVDAYLDYVRVVLPYQSRFRSFGYNISITGFWHKLFDVVGEYDSIAPLWRCPALARWGTLLSDLVVTSVVLKLGNGARTIAQRDVTFASVVTAMLLVSPVTWDFSLPLLLVPLALIARCSIQSRENWMLAPLILILVIIWTPQILLTKLALAGRTMVVAPWTFMIGAPSLKFYALLGTFALGLAASRLKVPLSRRRWRPQSFEFRT